MKLFSARLGLAIALTLLIAGLLTVTGSGPFLEAAPQPVITGTPTEPPPPTDTPPPPTDTPTPPPPTATPTSPPPTATPTFPVATATAERTNTPPPPPTNTPPPPAEATATPPPPVELPVTGGNNPGGGSGSSLALFALAGLAVLAAGGAYLRKRRA